MNAESPAPTTAHENTAGHEALREASRAAGLESKVDRFLFLRHGRTAGNIGRIFQHPDIPLATEGFADADAAALILKACEFAHICASDMPRAWLTAGRVAALTGKAVHAHPTLRERYFGDLIGTSSVGLDWRCEPANGETMQTFVERVSRGVSSLLQGGPTPLLVSHGGVLRVLAGAVDVPLGDELTANALPLEFRRVRGRWDVVPLVTPVTTGAPKLGAA